MNQKHIIAVLIVVIMVLLNIILQTPEPVKDTSGENEIYRERIEVLLKENDSLKSRTYKLARSIDSLNNEQKNIKHDNNRRHKRIDSLPDDSLDIVLHRMLDSLGAELNAR